jgi:hypothetical protein
MRNVCVVAVLIALALGLSGCSKCDVYKQWTGPYSCNDTAPK